MKLRIAKKVIDKVANGSKYRQSTVNRALSRHAKTKSCKDDEKYWNALMFSIGPSGRAELLSGWGMPGKESDW